MLAQKNKFSLNRSIGSTFPNWFLVVSFVFIFRCSLFSDDKRWMDFKWLTGIGEAIYLMCDSFLNLHYFGDNFV